MRNKMNDWGKINENKYLPNTLVWPTVLQKLVNNKDIQIIIINQQLKIEFF